MNVPLSDSTGLRIYRELMHREQRCAAMWRGNYGPEALQRKPDMNMMQNLGRFEKYASVPMPLDVQLATLRKERIRHTEEELEYQQNTFPKLAKCALRPRRVPPTAPTCPPPRSTAHPKARPPPMQVSRLAARGRGFRAG